jgi:hypothetical protein
MGMIQKLNENPKLGVGVGVAVLIVALGLVGFQLYGGSRGLPEAQQQAFYSDDNGKTFFKDDINKVVPFDHNGKHAYRADVFKGPDGKEFAGLLYRHTATGRNEMQDYINRKVARKDDGGLIRGQIEQRGMEVKPASGGDKAWVLADEYTVEALRRQAKTPSGAKAELVLP